MRAAYLCSIHPDNQGRDVAWHSLPWRGSNEDGAFRSPNVHVAGRALAKFSRMVASRVQAKLAGNGDLLWDSRGY